MIILMIVVAVKTLCTQKEKEDEKSPGEEKENG